jgi:vacuolar iron transporter family protein
MLTDDIKRTILKFQKNEITEHHVYSSLARIEKGGNRKVLERISADELSHYMFFKKYSGMDTAPDRLKVLWYSLVARVFGITFTAKLMENGEEQAAKAYRILMKKTNGISEVIRDENRHENALIAMIEEEQLGYISSMVLGLNDAIVELTGALAGFTFALQHTKVIGIAGFITGVAAALSMAAAEYLSQKSEKTGRSPLKAALYTGTVYFAVVFILVAPYFLVASYIAAFGLTLAGVFFVILFFSFFVSTVQGTNFRTVFWEMTFICLGVSLIAFLIGLGARQLLHIQI